MKDITISRMNINPETLDIDLRASLGTVVVGLSTNGESEVTVHLDDKATPAQMAQASQMVEQHDASKLSARQQVEVDRNTRLEELRRANAKTLDLAEYESAPSEIRQLAEKIAWLELELAARH